MLQNVHIAINIPNSVFVHTSVSQDQIVLSYSLK